MAENEKKETVLAKFGGWFGIVIAIFAGMFFLDQGEIFGETVPAGWTRLKQVLTRGSLKVQKAYWQCAIWLKDYLKLAKWITLVWWSLSGLLLVAGIVGKSHGWSENASLTLRLIGLYLFAGYWFAAAMLAKPLYYGVHALKKGAVAAANAVGQTAHHWLGKLGLETPVPELAVAEAEKIEEGAKAFQRFFFTVASIVLLFGTFFAPSGELSTAVGLLAVGLPLAALSAFAAKLGKKTDLGWQLLGGAVLIAFVVLVFRIFGQDLVPAWFTRRNRSELIVMVAMLIPCSLWIAGAFWKAKADGLNTAAKRLFWVSLAVLVLLAFKGVLTTHELASTTDETASKMQRIEDTATKRVLNGAQLLVDPPSGHASAGAHYQAPPAGNGGTGSRSVGHEASKPQAAARARRKIAAPPSEPPKQYASPAQAMNDLDALGY